MLHLASCLFLVGTVSPLSLFLMNLTVLCSAGQVFSRIFLYWDLSDFFFHSKTEVLGSGEKD